MGEELYNAYKEKISLTKEQEACVNYSGNRTLLVKGCAGAGKSLVIEALAKKLMVGYSADKHNKVAIFTFSNTLNSATKEFLEINDEQGDYITVTTLTSYITHVYNAIGGPKLKVYNGKLYTDLRKECVETAFEKHRKECGAHRFHDMEYTFWLEEFDWMKDMNVSVADLDYYLKLPRKGRGNKVRMSAVDRVAAFQLFTYYCEAMKSKNIGDWIDESLYMIRHPEKIQDKFKFDHILIDEAQDLSLAQMMVAMLFFRKDMVVAMDMNQRIFDKQWTPKLLGIEATTKKLTKSMRTTKQIDDLAESIRKNNDGILDEDDRSLRAIPEREGPIPQVVHLTDAAEEKRFVIDQIKKWLERNSNISIGIIAPTNKLVEWYAAWMTDAGIEHEVVAKDSTFHMSMPGVKIVNVYNAKGLEFARVIIPQFVEGKFPYAFRSDDDEKMQMFLAKSRNLVYVAMTRAKFSLTITYSGANGSRFLSEMGTDLYEAKGIEPSIGTTSRQETGSEKKQKNIELPPSPQSVIREQSGDLVAFFHEKGFEVIDKRSVGGCLWVVGDKAALTSAVKEAGKVYGAYGKFSEGGRATKHRPGWFTSCKK